MGADGRSFFPFRKKNPGYCPTQYNGVLAACRSSALGRSSDGPREPKCAMSRKGGEPRAGTKENSRPVSYTSSPLGKTRARLFITRYKKRAHTRARV